MLRVTGPQPGSRAMMTSKFHEESEGAGTEVGQLDKNGDTVGWGYMR